MTKGKISYTLVCRGSSLIGSNLAGPFDQPSLLGLEMLPQGLLGHKAADAG